MENKALYNFINEACKRDDENLDISIAELTSAINTLKREKEKREEKKKRDALIDAFLNAYKNLRKVGVQVNYDFEMDYLHDQIDDWADTTALILDNPDAFEFF